MPVSSLEIAKVAAMAADSKKATDILLLDLSDQTDVCDYFLICTGANGRMVDSIVDEIREKVRANCDVRPLATEGREGLRWVLVDYGSVVVHVFQPETRDYYRLERLWGDSPRVRLDLEGVMVDEPVWTDDDDDTPDFEIFPDEIEEGIDDPDTESDIESDDEDSAQ